MIRQQGWLIPAQDRVTLMRTTVYRPQGSGPFPLAVINHGTTQNELRRAGYRVPQYTVLTEWLVAHGYAVAVPQRPGHGGDRRTLLTRAQGGCASADFAQAGQGAAASIGAAIDYLSRQSFVRKTGTVAFGHSAGGWGVLALTTQVVRPLAGVVAFAPGLGGRADDVAGKNCASDRLVAAARSYGEKARVPSPVAQCGQRQLLLAGSVDERWSRRFAAPAAAPSINAAGDRQRRPRVHPSRRTPGRCGRPRVEKFLKAAR